MQRSEFLRLMLLGGITVSMAPALAASPAATPAMQRRPIPSSGQEIGVIGCGTWQTFDVGESAQEREPLAKVLEILFAHGGSVIDSSPMYGRAESVAGDLLAAGGWQSRAFVATKVWTTGKGAGIKQMQTSIQRLRDERIELMQIHNLLDWRTHLRTLRAWKDEGRIRYIGITHYTESAYPELEAIMRAESLDFVQFNYSIAERAAEERLLPLAAERGIAVLINQPFGGGRLLRTLASKPLPEWAGEIGCNTWAQLLLKFVLGHKSVTCAIPGTGRPRHMVDNCAAGLGAMPDAAQRRKIAQLWSG